MLSQIYLNLLHAAHLQRIRSTLLHILKQFLEHGVFFWQMINFLLQILSPLSTFVVTVQCCPTVPLLASSCSLLFGWINIFWFWASSTLFCLFPLRVRFFNINRHMFCVVGYIPCIWSFGVIFRKYGKISPWKRLQGLFTDRVQRSTHTAFTWSGWRINASTSHTTHIYKITNGHIYRQSNPMYRTIQIGPRWWREDHNHACGWMVTTVNPSAPTTLVLGPSLNYTRFFDQHAFRIPSTRQRTQTRNPRRSINRSGSCTVREIPSQPT